MDLAGAIDCDVHPAVPSVRALHPYLDDHWREAVEVRGIESLDSISYPANAPISARPDWRPAQGPAGGDPALLGAHHLDPHGVRLAICNCLYGVQLLFSEDMAAAFARAVNDWVAREWLDRDPRLRASIVVPVQSPERAVDEIERLAPDRRFVQVLVLAMGETPLGRRSHWPIYAAAARHGLPLGIHAGSGYRHPVTSVGWPSWYVEDYANQSTAFQAQVTSLVTEGVFSAHPGLKVVLIESGVTWLPGFLWRFGKFWHGTRSEIPWVDRPPAEIVRDHFRLTLQPFDAPDDAATVARIVDHLGSDRLLLFSSDYPHWQYDGDRAVPAGIPETLRRRMMVDNPLETYPRLQEGS